ncbi:DUF6783 domain-containing protein [Blautia hominis]|uniref:DUF6783 domain-containing protein n=1 Tax=Blautia hominis TaxID=2025493 RepID=UPI0036F1F0E5
MYFTPLSILFPSTHNTMPASAWAANTIKTAFPTKCGAHLADSNFQVTVHRPMFREVFSQRDAAQCVHFQTHSGR